MGGVSDDDMTADRVILRASADYLLRIVTELAELFAGDLILGIVFLALVQASISHIPRVRTSPIFDPDGVVPTSARRVVSTLAISNSLGMPRETVRRHINRLVEAGYCTRDERRRISVLDSALRRPEIVKAIRANRLHLESLTRLLSRNGLLRAD